MARRPNLDEPFTCHSGAATRGTRVFVPELAKFLSENSVKIRRFAERHGILYWLSRGHGHKAVPYVTEAGAMRAIAYFRAKQGAAYMKGQQLHEVRERVARNTRIWRRRKGDNAPTNGGNTPHLPIANPPAGTEDEAPEAQAPPGK